MAKVFKFQIQTSTMPPLVFLPKTPYINSIVVVLHKNELWRTVPPKCNSSNYYFRYTNEYLSPQLLIT